MVELFDESNDQASIINTIRSWFPEFFENKNIRNSELPLESYRMYFIDNSEEVNIVKEDGI